MGTSSTPNKKPPAKKAKGAGGGVGITPSTSKPTSTKKSRAKATKPKKSKAASSSATATATATATAGQDPSLLVTSSGLGAAAVASAAGQILCIPTNLPMLIVDNGGWTVKYGLVVPWPTTNNDNTTNAATNTINSGNDNSQTNAINNNNNNIITNPQNEPPNNSTNTKHTTMNTMYNATAQPPQQLTLLAGDEITTRMKNLGQLSWNHPCERGMICDGATQLRVWNRVLQVLGIRAVVPAGGAGAGGARGHVTSSSLLSVVVGGGGKGGGGRIGGKQQRHQQQQQQQHAESASLPQNISSGNCAFLLLEPPFVPSVISEGVDRILFRELGMGRVARLMGPCMAAVKYISFGRCSDSNSGGSISSCLFSEEEEKVNDREAVALVKKEIEKRMKKNNATTAVKEEVLPEVVCSDNVNNQLVAGDEARGATEMMNEEKSINKNGGDWINDGTECCCVVDSGYSFTHVVPTHRGGAVENAIRRLNLGGKILTNLLKEAVTYRQWNMMDEYHIVNDCKEQLCFVSTQFDAEMKQARITRRGFRWFDREFLLPDFVNTFRGTVRLPAPLQWKQEMEEEKRLQKEMEKQQLEKKKEKRLQKQEQLKQQQSPNKNENVKSNMQIEENASSGDAKANGGDQQKPKNAKPKKKKKSSKEPEKNKSKRKHHAGRDTKEDDDDIDDDSGSDEESDKQRLQRLKQMREQERKRREQESLERQALAMSVERFAIPEVLFRPSDMGLDCGGIAEAIVESINACDGTLRAAMYHNVLLVGGNAKIPGFKERVELELRKLAPVNYRVRVYIPEDPVSYAWEGAKQFSARANFQEQFCVDRISWEAMKKAGKDQKEIWGGRIHNVL